MRISDSNNMTTLKSLFDDIRDFFDKNPKYGVQQVLSLYDDGCVMPDTVVGVVIKNKKMEITTNTLVAYIPVELERTDGDMKTICDTLLAFQNKNLTTAVSFYGNSGLVIRWKYPKSDQNDFAEVAACRKLIVKYLSDRSAKIKRRNITVTSMAVYDADTFESNWRETFKTKGL